MLCSFVRQVGVEDDFEIAVFEQPADQHTQNLSANTAVLAVRFTDLNTDFRYAVRYFAIIAFTNQTVTFFDNKQTTSKSFFNFFLGRTKPLGKPACAITTPSFHQETSCFTSLNSA